MEKSLESTLRRRFARSLSAISVKSWERMESEVEIDGKRRSADLFEAVVKGDIFRLYIRQIRINRTFFKKEEVYDTYELDRAPCKAFSLREVLTLIRDSGYTVSSSLFESGRDNYGLPPTTLHRKGEGVNAFFRSLRSFGIKSLRLVLDYDSSAEGSFSLSLLLSAPEAVDTGNLSRLELGIHDFDREVSDDKKKAMIRYLSLLSVFSMHAGLEIFNIVDYMSLIEVMQERGRDEDYSFAIEKGMSQYCLSHPEFGGESYADYGIRLTPLDFAWYLDGFRDTDSQRNVFFSYYDSVLSGEDGDEVAHYLGLLGLKKGASWDDVQKAYKSTVQRFHPDKISSLDIDPSFTDFANMQMQRVNEAYDRLKRLFTS